MTIKYIRRCTRVTSPSMRSKLLQKLFVEFTPKISARAITPTNTATATASQENVGRYDGTLSARMSHEAKRISTRILKTKFFPVIKGKNIELATIKEIKGTKNMPPMSIYLKLRLIFIR